MATTTRRLTEEQFLRLPDTGRKYELVNGEVREVPAGVLHDVLAANLIARLRPFTRGRGFLCSSQAGFRMNTGAIRSPDVSFIRRERLPGGQPPAGFGDFAPDLCVEIISSSENRDEMAIKVAEYFASGAEQVWHLFPEVHRVNVYRSPDDVSALESSDDLAGESLLPGFRCPVSELFELD